MKKTAFYVITATVPFACFSAEMPIDYQLEELLQSPPSPVYHWVYEERQSEPGTPVVLRAETPPMPAISTGSLKKFPQKALAKKAIEARRRLEVKTFWRALTDEFQIRGISYPQAQIEKRSCSPQRATESKAEYRAKKKRVFEQKRRDKKACERESMLSTFGTLDRATKDDIMRKFKAQNIPRLKILRSRIVP